MHGNRTVRILSESRKAGKPESRKAGHRLRLEGLVARHREEMVAFARSIADSGSDDAEGIVQDALVFLLERVRDWPEADSEALAVVLHHVKNVARNRRRRARRRAHLPLAKHDAGDHSDPWHEAWRIRARQRLAVALQGLTDSERDVASMRLLLGMSHQEIAHKRDCSVNTVKVLYRRARLRMREALGARARHGTAEGPAQDDDESSP